MTSKGWLISFPPPGPLLNMNDSLSHWEKAGLVKEWRTAAFFHARNEVNSKRIPTGLPYIIVGIDLPVRSLNKRRDAHNMYPTVKACVDGLVDAKIIDDDDVTHLATREPVFHQRTVNPNVDLWIWVQ